MDSSGLQSCASELESLIADLRAAMEDTPDVLVKPTLEKVTSGYEDLQQSIAAASKASVSDSQAETSSIIALAAEMREMVADGPWLNPPKLRRMRQTGEALTRSIAQLRMPQRNVISRPLVPQTPTDLPAPLYAAAMADGVVAAHGGATGASGGPMDVDEALAMLLEKKQGGYRGGLCGIVHAAGVQEMVAIPAHSPGKFEFVFAPKSAAAFNLHQFSAMI
mmetsp:Transcript_87595/g.252933  ORF Transcript_87595/g.252933 Transcript_87595/m.252933 type:complete len:221 (-) Transcript_87595:138-800(-)